MATNFVQNGNTIAITAAAADIASGDPVVVGDLVAVVITDIATGRTGDGFVSGVFQLPKLAADVIPAGKRCSSRMASCSWPQLTLWLLALPGRRRRKTSLWLR